MSFMKIWSVFNFIATIFVIIYFYDFFANLTPIKPWIFILVCIFIIAFLLRDYPIIYNILNLETSKFDKAKENVNYPLFSYINAHYENGSLYNSFLLNLFHFGLNAIFIYAFLKNNNFI